ncbi:MAG: shikimate kinase [Mucinivorans sp.]
MRYFLIGFMGSGKSTLGRSLAKSMGMEFIDLDRYLEQQQGRTIADVFALDGEPYFRALESKYLREVSRQDNIIVSCGGGTPCSDSNMEFMNSLGRTIYLKLEPDVLAERLENGKFVRPLIASMNSVQLLEYITTTLIQREVYYNQATIIVANPSRDVSQIVDILSYYTDKTH